ISQHSAEDDRARKWQNEREHAENNSLVSRLAELLQVDLKADKKHEQELAQLGPENDALAVGPKHSGKPGPQDYPGQDEAENSRQSESLHRSRKEQDHHQADRQSGEH